MSQPKWSVGFYVPTKSFRSIPEHIAVMEDLGPDRDFGPLVACFGPSDDEHVAESRAHAALFVAAPALLARVRALETALGDAMGALIEAQGEWGPVSEAYAPESMSALKGAVEDAGAVLYAECPACGNAHDVGHSSVCVFVLGGAS